MFTSATAIVLSCLAGVLSCIVSLCKLVDMRRQNHKPARHEFTRSAEGGVLAGLASRKAPVFSAKSTEKVARLADVIDSMHTGDVILFSGRGVFSYLIRIASWSPMSHAAMVLRDHAGHVFVAEVVEKFPWFTNGWDKGGFRITRVEDYVADNPGQVYWAPVAPEYNYPLKFNRAAVARFIHESHGLSYGWLGIGYQLLTKAPFLRILTYLITWRDLDKEWNGRPPYCSWWDTLAAMVGGQDPTPGLAPQLTTPAEIERSKLWSSEKVALIP